VSGPAPVVDKERVALASVAASAAMTLAKLLVGVATGSLGILAEAAHSLLDLGATLITWGAVRVSDRPPDKEHPYGHAKIEGVSALAETGLLFVTSAWIVYEALQRLLNGAPEVKTTWWAAGVMVGSMVTDFFRARALGAAARAAKSQALEADALHFSSDLLSAGVVLIGLALVRLGWPRADAVAALGVAVFVCLAGWRLGRRTIDALIDTAPEGVADDVRRIALATPGIAALDRVRVRPSGPVLFVDLDVAVSRTHAFERVNDIKRALVERIARELPQAECAVHIRAVALDEERIIDRIRLTAQRRGLPVSQVIVHQVAARLAVTLTLEVDGRRTLGEAHGAASVLEDAIREEFGGEVEIDTHIEPAMVEESDATELPAAALQALEDAVRAVARERPAIRDVHNLRARDARGRLFVTLHCRFAPEQTVESVHEVVEEFEQALRLRLPGARRIVVHAEPLSAIRPRTSSTADPR